MEKFIISALSVLAMLASTNAMAQFTLGDAEVVVEKTNLRCSTDTNCLVRVGKANHYKSAKCVLYKVGSTVKVCQFEEYVCDDKDSYTNDYFDAVTKKCAFANPPCATDLECEDGDGCTIDYCGWNGSCYRYERWNCTPCLEDTDCTQEVQTECVQSTESSWAEGCMPDGYCDRVWSESAYCVNGCDDADYMCLQDQDIECQDGDPCTVDSFNTTSQTCENVPSQDGVLCDDGVWCTYEDYCMGGECAPGEDYSDVYCSDNNPCTVDTCLGNNYSCSNTFKTCDDANACTMDSCNGATGGCVNTVKTCSDGNACTVDSCLASTGACSNQAKNCDDSNSCTTDSCDSATGNCVNVGTTCNDNNACTTDSCTAAGACVNTAKSCDDNIVCTSDSCDSATGACVNAANTAACNDGSACTSNDVCANKVCGGTAVVCNDNNACTTDSCNPVSGCVFTTISGCVPPVSCSLASKTAGAGVKPLVDFSCQGAFTDAGQTSEATYTGVVGTNLYNTSASGFYCWLKSLNGIPVNWGAMTTQAQKLAACKQAMVGLNACQQEIPISVTTDAWGACVVSFNTAP